MALKVHDLWLDEADAAKATLKITAKTSGVNRLSFPQWETVAWEIPARAEFRPLTICWYNGAAPDVDGLLDSVLETAPEKDRNNWRFAGTLIVGTEGTIHTTGHNMWFEVAPGGTVRRRAVQSPGGR